MNHRRAKDRLFDVWADVAKALSSPKRIELLDLLAQSERTVDQLAQGTGLTVNNTSSHLSVLKASRLVETRKEAQFVHYRLADDVVVALLRAVQAVARRRIHEVESLVKEHLDGRDSLEPVNAAELRRRMKAGDVTIIDVRPAHEYAAGHIRGALSVPLAGLDEHFARLPRNRPVVAYCRGPYCFLALEAVQRLRARGVDARRLEGGLPDWRMDGLPIDIGVARVNGPAASARRPRARPSSKAS